MYNFRNSTIFDWISRNKSELFLFTALFLFVIFIRLPAHYQISIDDISKLASTDPYNDLIRGAATWNRFAFILIILPFKLLQVPFSVFMFTGGLAADAFLVALCMKLSRFFVPSASYATTAVVTLCIALMPYMFVLFHFNLIGYSLATTFAVLFLILKAVESEKRWALPTAIILGCVFVAGSYQSGLYWYALIVLSITIRDALRGANLMTCFKQLIRHGIFMAIGMVIYAVLAKLTSMGIAPAKHEFATLSEMKAMFERRTKLKYFDWHFRSLEFFPKSLKIFVFYHAVILASLAMLFSRNRRVLIVITLVFAFAVLMCGIQILMFPYNYTHVPVRSFWWFGLFYALCFLMFMTVCELNLDARKLDTLKEIAQPSSQSSKFQSLSRLLYRINFGAFAAVSITFAISTYNLGLGLNTLRKLDETRAKSIIAQLEALQFQYDRPIVLALGGRDRVAEIHNDTIGATKTLFWAVWTRVPYMIRYSGKSFNEASSEQFKQGRERCLAEPPIGPMPNVSLQAEYVLVCI